MNKNGIKEDKAMMNIKSIKSLAALLIVGCTFVSCSSTDTDDVLNGNGNPTGVKTYTLTVKASKGNDAITRAISLSGSTLSATWSVGDEVKVYNGGTEIGTLTAQNSGTNTTLTGSLTTAPNVNDELTLKFLSPDYAAQEGTLEYIEENCDYAVATVTVTDVSTTTITTSSATFVNQQAIVKFSLTDNNATPASINVSKLTMSLFSFRDSYSGTRMWNAYTITPVLATDILYVAIPRTNINTLNLYATDGSNTYIYTKSNITFTKGKYYEITVRMKSPTAPAAVQAIDLGLPSGILWANMNVGATAPEEFGDFFAWGETIPKNKYEWSTYKYCNGNDENNLTKYCNNVIYGYNGYTDNLTVLDDADDAAISNWGNGWRMPTKDEVNELIQNTNIEWIDNYNSISGLNGYKFTNKSDASKYIFLPATGYIYTNAGPGLFSSGYQGNYPTSTLDTGQALNAIGLYFDKGSLNSSSMYSTIRRFASFTVRPVCSSN